MLHQGYTANDALSLGKQDDFEQHGGWVGIRASGVVAVTAVKTA